MKTKPATLLLVGIQTLLLICSAWAAEEPPPAPSEATAAPTAEAAPAEPGGGAEDEAAEGIRFGEETELATVVNFLAQQANMVVFFDPNKVFGVAPDGKPLPTPTVKPIRFPGEFSAERALRAILKAHDLQLLEDLETKTWMVKKRDASEPRITEVVPVRFGAQYSTNSMAITNLSGMLQGSFPTARVVADPRTSQLLINCTKTDWLEISNLLVRLDVPIKQILIEARFVQTTARPETIKGIDWSGTLEGQTFTFGNGLTQFRSITETPATTGGGTTPSGRPLGGGGGGSSTRTTLDSFVPAAPTAPGLSLNTASGFTPHTAFLSAEGVKAVLSFLNKDSDSEFIANPQAVAMEGQLTELSDIVNIPVFEEQQGNITGNSTQPNTVKPNYELKAGGSILNEVGVKLIVTPRITGDTNVFMDLKPEISSKGPDEIKVLGGRRNESPTFLRRKITTQAIVPSGHTLVLGGLTSDEKAKSHVKIPILGDLPVVGLAFRKDSKLRNKKNLIIFVTPTIIENGDFRPNERGREFLRTPVREMPEDETTAWDSGKPHDWTKPVE